VEEGISRRPALRKAFAVVQAGEACSRVLSGMTLGEAQYMALLVPKVRVSHPKNTSNEYRNSTFAA
jgi:hypothetical protein